ncbi:MAG: hypothetical protein ACLFQ8_01375 [Candidatus Aenigmatarchaeota archaeon]
MPENQNGYEKAFEDIKEAKEQGKDGISMDEYAIMEDPDSGIAYRTGNGDEKSYLEEEGWEKIDNPEDTDMILYDKNSSQSNDDTLKKYDTFHEELGDHTDALENIENFIKEYGGTSDGDGLGDLYDKNGSSSNNVDSYERSFDFNWNSDKSKGTIKNETGGSVLNAGPLDLFTGPFVSEVAGNVYEGMTAKPSYDSEIPEKYRVFEELWEKGYKDEALKKIGEKGQIAEKLKEEAEEKSLEG